ncbi:UNVERIFIED_CONTAM: hypothetical protein Slati_4129100 [Sesamum latifolium]|uniref:Uncharacterized protein n=1 Tax=Sesamum latifolium TaxID=2727402 RepID=A0AAW2T917_9LAMI
MAKSMRSKREKRLRAIRRELVEPIYEKKDAAKLAAQEAALAAPKLPVRSAPSAAMEFAAAATTSSANDNGMDIIISFSFSFLFFMGFPLLFDFFRRLSFAADIDLLLMLVY